MRPMPYAAAVTLLLALAVPLSAQQPRQKAAFAYAPALDAAQMAAIRKATEKYMDVKQAIADGYIEHAVCVDAPMEGAPRQLGAMGYHYFRPDLLGITAQAPRVDGAGMHGDFTKPGILVYEPQPDGSVKLVAIENLIWAKAWKDAGNTSPPAFNGHEYYYMHDNPGTEVDEAHGFEPHYELHMWLYKENPAGMFSPFNATASCAHAKGHGGH